MIEGVNRQRVIRVAGACALAGILTLMLWPWGKEPSYQGKRLGQWLDLYGTQPTSDKPLEANAISNIGGEALPTLLKWISLEPARPWQTNALALASKLPKPFGQWAAASLGNKREVCIRRAKSGFEILGSRADPAVPRLFRLLARKRTTPAATNIAFVMRYLGRDAMRPLAEQVRNRANPPELRRELLTSLLLHTDWCEKGNPAMLALCGC